MYTDWRFVMELYWFGFFGCLDFDGTRNQDFFQHIMYLSGF